MGALKHLYVSISQKTACGVQGVIMTTVVANVTCPACIEWMKNMEKLGDDIEETWFDDDEEDES